MNNYEINASRNKNSEKIPESDFIPNAKHKTWLYFLSKRCFDLFFSFLAIIVLLPLFIIVSIIVKASSKGPFIFGDQRIGKNGKIIKVYKFRSMYIDAEKRLKQYLTKEQYEKWLVERKIDNDPRITKVGKFIRKTSIDELPQLFNIFLGSMSFVGPRPITLHEIQSHYTDVQRKIIESATPGLTGYWQVCGRSNVEYNDGNRQKLELTYFEHRGFFYDIGIIFKTIPAVFRNDGAK